ncbi:MAG: thioesterase family protein [Sphingobium sp.]
MTAHFYRKDGGFYHPTPLAYSPWERDKQNGVALGGLATFLIETVSMPAPMATARLAIDILSAAAHAPTQGRTRIVREGKRIQMVEAELIVEGRPVARATALRVRLADSPVVGSFPAYPAPEDVPEGSFMHPGAFGGSLETRPVRGGLRELGPGTLWARFGHEHVLGTPLSPLLRAAILADFGGGVGGALGPEWSHANLDIALHLSREPDGEWLLIDATTFSAGQGFGHSDALLADRRGVFARTHQTLFIAPRGRA